MSEFKLYRRTGLSEMRPYVPGEDLSNVSVSPEDTPETDLGMIARDPKNHADQWYVAHQYFEDNLESADETPSTGATKHPEFTDEQRLQWRMDLVVRFADHTGMRLEEAAEAFKKAEAVLTKTD